MTSTDELDRLWRDGLATLADQLNPPMTADPEQRVAIRLRRRRRIRTATKLSVVVALIAVAAIIGAALTRGSDHASRITSRPPPVPVTTVAVVDAPGGALSIAFPGRDPGYPPVIHLPSGLIRFRVSSEGAGHELVLDGPSGFHVDLLRNVSTASSRTTDVELAPGRYLMHCLIPGHTEAGEEATVTVAAP
jgi:hypothetical protein